MTIAAGFKFATGILLCADTQHTYPGAMKLNASKIVSRNLEERGGGQLVFAISGSVPYAHMAIEKCVDHVKGQKPKERTGTGIRLAIEDALESFHQNHVYPHPSFHQNDGPDFQLLIATRSGTDKKTALFATNDSAVTEVPDYDCVGMGAFLAHYLVPTMFRHKNMGMRDVANVAIHVLQETKDYVDSCGGSSDFIVLNDNGIISPIASWDISQQESFARAFRAAVMRLFVVSSDLDVGAEEVHKEFKWAEKIIDASRNQRKAERRAHDAFYGTLERTDNDL